MHYMYVFIYHLSAFVACFTSSIDILARKLQYIILYIFQHFKDHIDLNKKTTIKINGRKRGGTEKGK